MRIQGGINSLNRRENKANGGGLDQTSKQPSVVKYEVNKSRTQFHKELRSVLKLVCHGKSIAIKLKIKRISL